MEELLQLQEMLRDQRPSDWDKIPDIPLYMDQVLYYINNQFPGSEQQEPLTSSMVNNYTKSGVLPRAEGKRYNRDHLAYLTDICIFKQVLPVKDVDLLLRSHRQIGEIEERYKALMGSLDLTLKDAAEEMENYLDEEKLEDAAVHFALASFAAGMICRKYVEVLRQAHEDAAKSNERN